MNPNNFIYALALTGVLGGCGDQKTTAVGVEVLTGTVQARILTKDGAIQCLTGLDRLSEQKGNPIDRSTVSPELKKLKEGDQHIFLTKENNSGDVTLRVNNTVVAIFRKDTKRKLDAFYGGAYPSNYCDFPKDDGITLK